MLVSAVATRKHTHLRVLNKRMRIFHVLFVLCVATRVIVLKREFDYKPPNWAVMVSVSSGFDVMFQNWLYWFKRLELQNTRLILVAEDNTTYKKYSLHEDWSTVAGDVEKDYGDVAASYDTTQYHDLVSRRASYILQILEKYEAVIYSDTDVVWVSDPRNYLRRTVDFAGSLDATKAGKPYFCTGFLAFRRTKRSVQLLKDWEFELHHSQLNQPVFNALLEKRNIHAVALPAEQFPSGRDYFERGIRSKTVVLHNNFIQGYESKIERFKEAGYWWKNESEVTTQT